MNWPFENDNSAIVKTLAKRGLYKNKTRNMAAIMAIVLTAFLFTSVTSLAFGVQESIVLSLQMEKGTRADGEVAHMTEEQARKLISSDFVERAGCRQYVGYASNAAGHAVEINYADEVQQELTFCVPTHGNAPQAANEIATTDLALKAMGIVPEIGAGVPVEFELRGQTYHFDMVVSGWWEADNESISLMVISQSFMDENRELFPNTYSTDKELSGTYISAVVLKNKTNVVGQLKEFARTVGGNPDDISADNYINCSDKGVGIVLMQPSTVAAAAGFIALFVLCGYLLIYNIFDISVMLEVRQYGLLRTIGTTTRQIKRIVNRQAARLTLIGLPFGLILGMGVSYIFLPTVARELVNGNESAIQFSISPLIFVIASLLTVFTVWISIRNPAKKASKVSPLEAIRYTGQENYRKKETKRQGGAKLPYMAFANLGRNKRSSAFIMLSLLLCIVLFNSVIVITKSFDEEKAVSRITKTDFTVFNSVCASRTDGFSHRSDGLDVSVIDMIHSQERVANERYLYRNTVDDTDVTVDYGFGGIEAEDIWEYNGSIYASYENGGAVRIAPDEDNRFYGNVFGASEHFFDDLTIYEGETDKDRLKQMLSTGDFILLGIETNRLTGMPDTYMPFYQDIQVGDTVSFYKNGELFKTYTIIASASLVDTEIECAGINNGAMVIGGDAPLLYMPADMFAQIYEQPTLLNYGFDADGEKTQIKELLDGISENNSSVSYTSTDLIIAGFRNTTDAIFIIGSMIAVIFAMTSLINFTNMMVTNIITRSHEFATMQSIGMTYRQLRHMMMWEGVYYALGAGIIGCVAAAFFGLTILKNALNSPSMWYFTMNFTILPGEIVGSLYFIMAVVIPVIALRIFNKGSVVERLRMTE